jgi:PKHD-type hydroxylase
LTEYDASVEGHYGSHVDRDYGHVRNTHRKLSMTVQLSDPSEYDGGELLLYPVNLTPVTVPKQRGMTTFFRSDVIHEVRPVMRGIRRSMVVWIAGPELR